MLKLYFVKLQPSKMVTVGCQHGQDGADKGDAIDILSQTEFRCE